MILRIAALALLLLPAAAAAQDPRKDPFPVYPELDQRKIDEAIRRGVEYLKTMKPGPPLAQDPILHKDSSELILWTLLHTQVDEADPKFQQLLADVLATSNERVYKVAL